MPKSAARAPVPPINMLVYREDHARITRHAARMAADTGRTVSYAEAVRDMLDRLEAAESESGVRLSLRIGTEGAGGD